MPNSTDRADVERAFRATGNGWILEMVEPGPLMAQVAIEIDEFIAEYNRRFGQAPDPFALVDQNPDKAAAFFELYTNPPVSMDMRIAVWRLIHGADIQSVRFVYERDEETELGITLKTECGMEEYRGSSLGDFEIIRHFGMLTHNGKEILDGYYVSELPE
jgi:hypothetical protein